MQVQTVFGVGMLLWGVKTLCDATAGNRRQRAGFARMLRNPQQRRIIGRPFLRLLWWQLRSDTGRGLMVAGGIVACLVGSLLIAL